MHASLCAALPWRFTLPSTPSTLVMRGSATLCRLQGNRKPQGGGVNPAAPHLALILATKAHTQTARSTQRDTQRHPARRLKSRHPHSTSPQHSSYSETPLVLPTPPCECSWRRSLAPRRPGAPCRCSCTAHPPTEWSPSSPAPLPHPPPSSPPAHGAGALVLAPRPAFGLAVWKKMTSNNRPTFLDAEICAGTRNMHFALVPATETREPARVHLPNLAHITMSDHQP